MPRLEQWLALMQPRSEAGGGEAPPAVDTPVVRGDLVSIPDLPTPIYVQAPHHDPLACGLNYHGSCAACRGRLWPAPQTPEHHAVYAELCERCRQLPRPDANEIPPEPLPPEAVAQLYATLTHPRYRDSARALIRYLFAREDAA